MKFISIIVAMCAFISSAYAADAGAKKQLFCHDTYVSSKAKTTLTADIQSATKLTNVTIVPGPKSSTAVNSLSIDEINLKNGTRFGFETLATGVPAEAFRADVPADSKYKTDFNVIFTLGSKWLEGITSNNASVVAELLFYCDECGGWSAFNANMYCELR